MLRETMVERDNLYDQANYVRFLCWKYTSITIFCMVTTINDDSVQFMDKNDKQKGKIAALRDEISQLMVSEIVGNIW